jgi:hypothetical protein
MAEHSGTDSGGIVAGGNVADDGTERPMHDDSSQDSRQPAVGPAIATQHPVVPDNAPAATDAPYGEIIDIEPIGSD